MMKELKDALDRQATRIGPWLAKHLDRESMRKRSSDLVEFTTIHTPWFSVEQAATPEYQSQLQDYIVTVAREFVHPNQLEDGEWKFVRMGTLGQFRATYPVPKFSNVEELLRKLKWEDRMEMDLHFQKVQAQVQARICRQDAIEAAELRRRYEEGVKPGPNKPAPKRVRLARRSRDFSKPKRANNLHVDQVTSDVEAMREYATSLSIYHDSMAERTVHMPIRNHSCDAATPAGLACYEWGLNQPDLPSRRPQRLGWSFR